MSKASRQKQRIWLIIAFAVLSYFASQYSPQQATPVPSSQVVTDRVQLDSSSDNTIVEIIQQQRSDVQIEVSGHVVKLLNDDLDGSRHQKFIIKIPDGHTILIAHNIDLAPRINAIQIGDPISIYGEYEWNERGGVLHWTHHDPAGRHRDGWIKHQGRTYQ